MASKRKIRRRSCEGKVGFIDQTEAVKSMIGLKKTMPVYEKVRTYKCKFCNKWHIGHYKRR